MQALIKIIKGSKVVRTLLTDRVINGGDGTTDVLELVCELLGFDVDLFTNEEFAVVNQILLDITDEIEKEPLKKFRVTWTDYAECEGYVYARSEEEANHLLDEDFVANIKDADIYDSYRINVTFDEVK